MADQPIKKPYLIVKDHSLSGEIFKLIYNEELEMLETSPQPLTEKLPFYYQSDDYISHTESKRNLFEKVYHIVKALTLKRKLKLINTLVHDSKSLMDFGCGTGDFLQIAQQNGWTVVGIEPNEQARKIANHKTNNSVLETTERIAQQTKRFDVITLWHVLEHLPDLEPQISLFKSLLKPNGTLIIAVPNFKSYDASYYQEFWAAFDVPRHLWHFSKTAISKLVQKQDMKVVKTFPMKFDAFYVSLLSEKYKSGVMNPLKGFWIGWQSNLKAKTSGEYSSLIYCIKNRKN